MTAPKKAATKKPRRRPEKADRGPGPDQAVALVTVQNDPIVEEPEEDDQ